jgi:isoleucyl-tRNA synthetase
VHELLPLLASELNVRQVEIATSADALVTLSAKGNFRTLGKKFGKATPMAVQAVAAFDGDSLRAFERGEPLVVAVDGVEHALAPEDVVIERRASGALVVEEAGGRFAAIDPTITPELRQEGMARELVSRIQRLRKETGLHVSDRIRLWIGGDEDVLAAVQVHRDWIAGEVLARDIVDGGDAPHETQAAQTVDLDGSTARIALTREG